MSDSAYSVEWAPLAWRQLEALAAPVQARLVSVIETLATTPHPPPPLGRKLVGPGGYRLRIGEYRVIYEVDSTARRVVITWLGLRRDAYRRR